MKRTSRGATVALASSALILLIGSAGSARPTPPTATDGAVPVTAPANPWVVQAFAGGPMPALGEVPNQAHTASSTYRLLPVTLPGPDSSNQSARVRDETAAAELDGTG